jgi:hypothetical protein
LARLPIKLVPRSSREGIAGWLGESLKVRVRAAAERGKANAAAERVVAEALGVPVDRVRVIAGWTSPRKVMEISDLSETEVRRRLSDRGGLAPAEASRNS